MVIKVSKKFTHDEFVEIINTINPNIIIIGNYKTVRDNIKVECKICHHKWNPKARKLKEGCGCPICCKILKTKTTNTFIDEMKTVNSNIEIIGTYVGAQIKIKCKCMIDGLIWDATPAHLLSGKGCPKCAGNYRRSQDEFVEEMKAVNKDIEILGEFISIHAKIKCKCKVDNTIWYVEPNSLLRGCGCPTCCQSKGEKKIQKYLEINLINYIPQMKYECLVGVGGGLLSYDFYLPTYNLLIEYNGEFHDGSNGEFTQSNLDKQQEHDSRKRQYANENNIKLLEIWYWYFNNIEEILNKELGLSPSSFSMSK